MNTQERREALAEELRDDPTGRNYRQYGHNYPAILDALRESTVEENPEEPDMVAVPITPTMDQILDVLAADEKARMISIGIREVLADAYAQGVDVVLVDELASYSRTTGLGTNAMLDQFVSQAMQNGRMDQIGNLIDILVQITDDGGNVYLSPASAAGLQALMAETEEIVDPNYNETILVDPPRPNAALYTQPDLQAVLGNEAYGLGDW